MNRIMIVDDKADNLYLLRALLEGHGYAVEEARHGAEALVKARQNPPHLLVSDLLMPVMDGYTLLQHWKKDARLKQIPFVVYTATYTEPKDERLALDLGADAFIVKPTEPDVFMARLQEVLARQASGTLSPSTFPLGKEEVLLKQYNEVLIHRLEVKMEQLEQTNRELERDITERQRAEQALARERNLLRTLIDHLPDLIYAKDLENRFLVANRAMAESVGKSEPESLAGLTDAELHSAERAARFCADEQAVLRSGQVLVNREEFVLDSSGHRRWLLTTKVPLRDAQARVVGLVGLGRDITERKRAEEALHRSEALLVQAGQMAGLGAWEIEFIDLQNLAANPLRWSEEVYRIFGYQPGEVTPSHELFLARVHPADRPQIVEAMQEALRARHPYQIEHRIVRPDGTERVVLELAHTTFDPEGRPRQMIGAVQDITERKRLEQEHMAMEAQLRQRQKLESIGTLASGVAHEINNPIMGIMNYAQLIADKAAPESPAREYAREIIRETERVAEIVKNLLQFARHEKQTHSPARMTDIVEHTLSLLRAAFRRDHIALTVDLPPELPPIKCRSQQIQQVLMNLLTNARDTLNEKYPGPHPDKVLGITCRTFEKEGRRWMRLTVEDHGMGIPEAIGARILDPFFTTKPRDIGTGLGLSISHGIVQDHHGVLSFETEPGRGTQFHVDLPVDNHWTL